jgi:hypothetical protein
MTISIRGRCLILRADQSLCAIFGVLLGLYESRVDITSSLEPGLIICKYRTVDELFLTTTYSSDLGSFFCAPVAVALALAGVALRTFSSPCFGEH